MQLFRPPYGDYDDAVVLNARENGYYPIQWDVDSLDWKDYGVDSILNTVLNHKALGNGSIILCHNGAKYTADALDALLDGLKEKGYQGLAYSTTVLVDEDGKVIPCRANRRRRKNEFMKGNRVLKTLISLSKQKRVPRDYCIRKETVLKVGAYNYPRNFYEDLDLLMRLARIGVFFQPTYETHTATHRGKNAHFVLYQHHRCQSQ